MSTADLDHTVWRKSSRSSASGSDCVEVAEMAGAVAVRDSKDSTGPVLRFTPCTWMKFVAGLPGASGFETP